MIQFQWRLTGPLMLISSLAQGLISEYPSSQTRSSTSFKKISLTQQFYRDASPGKRLSILWSSYDPRDILSQQSQDSDEINFQVEGDEDEDDDMDAMKDIDDDDDDDNNDNDDDDDAYRRSPLISHDREWYPTYEEWIDAATENILDTEKFPLGSLSAEDVESIAGLMSAWVKRRSIDAALTVEQLLKRVVDDMRADNYDIQVTARLYTIAIDAWAKSGAKGSAQRAQHIHDAMVDMYEETGDPALEPSTISYNTLLNAHCKSSDRNSRENAHLVLDEMANSPLDSVKVDAITFATLMDMHSKSGHPAAIANAEELFDKMDDFGIKRNVFTFAALQNVYARSGRPDAYQKVEEILKRMQDLYDQGDLFAKPTCANYNSLLGALSRNANRTSAELSMEIVRKMELPVSEGGYDVEPDRFTYTSAILTCARCGDDPFGIDNAEDLLKRMEARAEEDERRRQEISSAAPASVRLDVESFNLVLTALSKTWSPDAVERIVLTIKRMEEYVENGQEHLQPTVRSWNALLNALSRSREKDRCQRAERVLSHMFKLHASGMKNVKPDAFSFAAVLSTYQKSSGPRAVERADDILRSMEELYENGTLDSPPDVYHYTIVCAAWAKSGQSRAPSRALQILNHMVELDAAGVPHVRPNTRTYNAVLDCLSKGQAVDDAERLLDHMLLLSQQGEKCVDAVSFNCVISGLCRSRRVDGGKRAEAVLDRFLAFNEDHPNYKPDRESFIQIIMHYRKSNEPDSSYRAEYILNWMISLFEETGNRDLPPTAFAFRQVMDSYSGAKHPDAGAAAERLLQQMKDLNKKHKVPKLVVDNATMNSVITAWSVSGDEDASRRAELHLDDMERKYEAGNELMQPESRSYGLVLNAWSKSSSFDKARRSLGILKRMEAQYQKGNKDVCPNEHAHALVINACAFTNSGIEAEAEAFRIAIEVLDKMLASKDCQPSSLAYGWFLQACGRLKVPEHLKNGQIERVWILCCKNGLVNAFVLNRFTGAASEAVYKKLMAPVLSKFPNHLASKEALKFQISPKDLPPEWTRKKAAVKRNEGARTKAGWWWGENDS